MLELFQSATEVRGVHVDGDARSLADTGKGREKLLLNALERNGAIWGVYTILMRAR